MKKSILGNALFVYAGVILFLLAGSALTQLRLWGFSWYGYFYPVGPILLLVLGVALPIIIIRNKRLTKQAPLETEPGDTRIWLPALVATVVAGGLFVLLSAKIHLMGDGQLLLARLEGGSAPVRPWNIGAYFVLDNLYALLGESGTEMARLAFRLTSWLAGIVFSLALMITSARLFDSGRDRLLFYLCVLTGGYALLFFGYVENYPLFVLCVGLFALSGLLVMRGKLGRFWPVLPMILGCLFHPFGVAMLPGGAYLILRDTALATRFGSIARGVRVGALVTVAVILVVAGYYFYTKFYFLRFAIVPLVADQFTVEGYTLLSAKHLGDWLNLLIVLAPSLPLGLVVLFSKPARRWFKRAEYRFLLLLLVPSLAITLLIDPKLGMARDWDIFGFAGIPLALLIAYALLDPKNRVKGYVPIMALAIGVNVLFLMPRALIPTMPDKAIAWFDDVSDLDVMKSATGRFVLLTYLEGSGRTAEAERRRSENSRLYPHQAWLAQGKELMDAGKVGQGERVFRKIIASAPTFSYAWTNLAVVHIQRNQFDSAINCLLISDGLNPYNPDTYDCFGQAYLFTNDMVRGEEYCLKATQRDPENFTARANLLRLYQMQNRPEAFETMLTEIAWLPEAELEYVTRAAAVYLKRSEFKPAGRMLHRALSMGLDSTAVSQLRQQYPELQVIP